jgi:hypothetical protein
MHQNKTKDIGKSETRFVYLGRNGILFLNHHTALTNVTQKQNKKTIKNARPIDKISLEHFEQAFSVVLPFSETK